MDRKIRVVQLVKGLDIGGISGGSERFGAELCQHLDGDQFEKLLLAFLQTGSAQEKTILARLAKSNVQVHFLTRIGQKQGPIAVIGSFLTAWRILHAGGKADILHSHFQVGTLLAIFLKTFGRAKFVVRTAHISREWGEGMLASVMRRIFTCWLFPLVLNLQVCVSKSIRDQVAAYPGTRIGGRQPTVIYNAIEIEHWRQPAVQQSGSSGFTVGSIGRLVQRKGYKYLLEAAKTALVDRPDLRFVIAGDGEERESLNHLTQSLGIQKQVTFLGQRSDVKELLTGWDLFVLPSFVEGLPTVILESMAAGVPVIATSIPGTVELVNEPETGWLVPPGDAKALACAIIKAQDDKAARARVAQNALAFVQGFSIQRIAQQYQIAYLQIIQSGQHPA